MEIRIKHGWNYKPTWDGWLYLSSRIIGTSLTVFDMTYRQIGEVETKYALGKGTSLKTDRFAIMDIDLLVEEPHSLRFEILDEKALKDLKFHIHYMDEDTREEIKGLSNNWDASITYPIKEAEPMIRKAFAAIELY